MFAASPKGAAKRDDDSSSNVPVEPELQHIATMECMDYLDSASFEIDIPEPVDPNKQTRGGGDDEMDHEDSMRIEEERQNQEEIDREEAEIGRETSYNFLDLDDLCSFCHSDVVPKNEVEIEATFDLRPLLHPSLRTVAARELQALLCRDQLTRDRIKSGADVTDILSERFASHFLTTSIGLEGQIRGSDSDSDSHSHNDSNSNGKRGSKSDPSVGALLALNQWIVSSGSYVFPGPLSAEEEEEDKAKSSAPSSTRKQRPLDVKRQKRLAAAAQVALEELEPAWMLPSRVEHEGTAALLQKKQSNQQSNEGSVETIGKC